MVKHKIPKNGFTLIEILVVIAIVGLLSTIAFVSYFGYVKDGNDFKRISDVTMVKTQLEIYKKTQLSYPTLSGATSIMSGAILIATQGIVDDVFAGKISVANTIKDPKTKMSYIYSRSKDGGNYQLATTLENTSNLIGAEFSDTAYAANGQNSYTALVQGSFIAENKNVVPGLIYSVVNGQKFVPGTPLSFDISTSSGKAKAILNGQNVNLAYDMNGNMVSNDGTLSLTGLLSQTNVIESSAINQSLYCSGTTKKYAPGENEIIETMTGKSLGQKIGWRYTTCSGDTGTMTAVKYACANIQGANFAADCTWNSCQTGYTALQAPDSAAPSCIGNILGPALYYPQNGAYNAPIAGSLSWNSVPQSNGSYKVYFGTDIGSLQLVNTVSATNYAFSALTKATTYYWKIQTCDINSQCADSPIWSFTTLPDAGAYGSNTGSNVSIPSEAAYCPAGIVCRADDVQVQYVGCDSGTSSFKDCSENNFGTSERSGIEYYGTTKTLGYRIVNNSNGTAKFKVQLADPLGNYQEKYSSTDFDSVNSMYTGGDGIAKNYYWKLGGGCGGDGLSGYTVGGKSSCYVQLYFRGIPGVAGLGGQVGKMKIINIDTTNAMWPDTEKQLSGNISGYSLTQLVITSTGAKYVQAGEPSAGTTILNDFDTSSLIPTKQYGYWKTLTYAITNNNNSTSYFNVGLGENTYSSITNVDSTGGLDADFNVAGANYDIGGNSIGNIYFLNGGFQGNNKCTPYLGGMSIGNNSTCRITLFFRADQAISATRSIIANLKLLNQPIPSPDSVTTIGLYGKKLGGNTILFTGFSAYSQNGWWIDYSGFQIQDDLTPTGFVWSRVMGWIDMSGLEPGSTIKVKYVGGVKKIQGKTYSQTAGWIDFDKVTDPTKQANIGADGKLHGWTWSQNYGWISFDNGMY